MSDESSPTSPNEMELADETTRGQPEPESPSDRRKRHVELAGAIIIGIAAVLTAVATYQGSQIDGTVQNKSTEAVGLTLQANDLYNDATAEQAEERDWFFGYLTAAANGENETADVLFRAMPAEVQQLTADWLELNEQRLTDESAPIDDPFFRDAEGSPVVESFLELQSTELLSTGDAVDGLAVCALFDSGVAEIQGDNYGLSTVFLAIALVVGGIAALLKGKAAQIIVLTTSMASLVLGAGVLVLAADQDVARQEAATEFFRGNDGVQLSDSDALVLADTNCPEQ